jgi:ElaA protein
VTGLVNIVATTFEHLSAREAYDVWRLRQDVFVVEQDCPYPDLDGRDPDPATRHVLLLHHERVAGYARVLDDGDVWRIGRVVLERAVRGRGWADRVVRTALALCPGREVVLDAQAPLVPWYATFGFTVDGPEFLEDGIPHVPMRRPAPEPPAHPDWFLTRP